MKFILGLFCVLFGAACASTSGVQYSAVAVPAPHSSLDVAYARAQSLQADYLVKASTVRREGRIVDGLAITAALATLGFGAFDAHPDNITAAALFTGVTAGARPVLNTAANEDMLMNGARALQCVQTRASALRLGRGHVGVALGVGVADFETLIAGTDNLETLDALLGLFIGVGEQQGSSSAGLSAALNSGRAARAKIAIGLKARRESPLRVGDAIDSIDRAVVLKRTDIAALVQSISKVEIPEPKPAAPVTDPASVMSMFGVQGVEGGMSVDIDQLIAVLNLMSTRVDQISPEYEEEVLKRVVACQIEFMAQ